MNRRSPRVVSIGKKPWRNTVGDLISHTVMVASISTMQVKNTATGVVQAIHSSPLDPRAEGTNKLIKEGATLLTSCAEVIESLRTEYTAMPRTFSEPEPPGDEPVEASPSDRKRVLMLLSPTPVDVNDVIRESGLPAAMVLGILLELELAGKVVRSVQQKVSLS